MFRKENKRKGVSRSPEEWLKYANARFNEYNVLQPWEDAKKKEKEKEDEKKPSHTNVNDKKLNSKAVLRKPVSPEVLASTGSNNQLECKEKQSSKGEPKKSLLYGINRNLATFTFSSLFMLTSADMSQWKLVTTAFVLGMVFAKYGFVNSKHTSEENSPNKESRVLNLPTADVKNER
ncbi:hypothetical protein SPOG_01005 [Schizosaccharomyces cryophilus OY26]|uniref:Uncharacterized protein n=1 Tax=Schizosaccharomyces cryophilus (strain OY26 / ATCC MYA-4695 / CBS 11777 / NBRC 106824 / NRRL Y48691) TaxID=653667 RepID=S9VVN3_SCHCR|nr:uncharacterized protein SPOG_01005 [Schizosaccharomyces cryophilus OY26]EPY50244.1 hypothetical protein SPOG_01005 [Schizosaccharomyces cryophilus OY26]